MVVVASNARQTTILRDALDARLTSGSLMLASTRPYWNENVSAVRMRTDWMGLRMLPPAPDVRKQP
jgi:hypothetical protein